MHRASKYLRGILVGGLTHVDCLVGVNLVRVVHYLKHHFQLDWDAKRGSPLDAFKQWMDDKGWQVQQPWVWAIQGSFCKIDLRLPDVDWVSELQHRLRDGWRWFMFVKFLDQDRHDNLDFDYTIQDFLQFDFKGMRKLLDVNSSFRTVLLGAACSPACFQNGGPFDTSCIWNCGGLGNWDHICWECELRPSNLVANDPILKRFGWWKMGCSSEHAVWMGKVVQTIWSLRYPKGDG